MTFLRRHAHAVAGTFLLTACTGTALALYFELPLSLKAAKVEAAAEHSHVCPKHSPPGEATEAAISKSPAANHDACGHADAGCCKDKTDPVLTLPPGHPPVAGYTIASEQPASK